MLEFKTNGLSNPKGLPKIYFCCCSSDFDRCFGDIAEEIFSVRNCSIWYKKNISDVCDLNELEQMNLVVIPVTSTLLTSYNETFEREYEFIMQKHIPILPVIFDSGLDKLYEEKFGNIQYLNRASSDITEISYGEKLRKYLDSVLVSDETAEKIKDAFEAYVFISYRKKDRDYAHELMKLIHKNELCRDFATWYDEFLLPGENFNVQIQDALKKSDLFALVVTPNILENPNYVITHEYPIAVKLDKPVIPFEAQATERSLLEQNFSGIPECISVDCIDSFTEKLLDYTACKTINNEPEHIFLMGLAYMAGIDVETDKEKGRKLIMDAAESGEFLPEAIEKLVNIYEVGDGVKVDCRIALEWQNKLISEYKRQYNETHSEESCNLLTEALVKAAELEEKANSGPKGYEKDVIKAYQRIIDFLNPHNEISPAAERTAIIISAYVKMSEYEIKRNSYAHSERYSKEALDYYEERISSTDISLVWKALYKAYLISFDSQMFACDSNPCMEFQFAEERLKRMDERIKANKWLEKAESVLESADSDCIGVDLEFLKAEIYIRKCNYMYTIGNFEGANIYSLYMTLLLSTDNMDNKSLLAKAWEKHGFSTLLDGDHQQAIESYSSAINVHKEIAAKNNSKENLYCRYYPEYIMGCIELLVKRPNNANMLFASVCGICEQLGKEYNAFTCRVYDVAISLKDVCESLSDCTDDIDYYTSIAEVMLEYEERFIDKETNPFSDQFCCRIEITYIILVFCVKAADLNKECGNIDTAQKFYSKAVKAFRYLEKREMVSPFILNTALRCQAEAENRQYDGVQIESITDYVLENAHKEIDERKPDILRIEKICRYLAENESITIERAAEVLGEDTETSERILLTMTVYGIAEMKSGDDFCFKPGVKEKIFKHDEDNTEE